VFLSETVFKEPDMKKFLKNLLIKNWHYKLTALLAAVFIWFYVVSAQNLSIVQDVPIEFSNYPQDMKIINNVKTSVEVVFEGRRDIINRMDKKNIRMQINLKEADEGGNIYILTAGRLRGVPRGVAVRNISPSRLNIIFEKEGGNKKNGKDKKKKG